MINRKRSELFFSVLLTCWVCILSAGGCSRGYLRMETLLDTPEHHVTTGFRLLDRERMADAEREFDQALRLDVSNARAMCGLGLIQASKGDFSKALQTMQVAGRNAKSEEDKALVQVGYLRIHTLRKEKKWLSNVEQNFHEAISISKNLPDAHFYLGIAYMEAYRFEEAQKEFNKVRDLGARYTEAADRELEIVSKIILANPESVTGKKIAILRRITRAETTALLVRELKLNELLKKALPRTNSETTSSSSLVLDWKDHPLKKDIAAILVFEIEGLRRGPGGSFLPDQNITRAEFAMAMADIMVSLKRNPALVTKFNGKRSPFSDVRNDEHYFSAVMLCTEGKRIMEPREGAFNPAGGISGVDALLIIRKLKEALGIY